MEPLGNKSLKSIAIVGNGLHAWTIAACLARTLYKTTTKVVVLMPSNAPSDSLGESTLPSISYFHRVLGLSEHQLMAVAKGTYKLATEYAFANNTNFYHAMSAYGSVIDNVAFQHHLTKARLSGFAVDLNRYSLPAVAAQLGKFGIPSADSKTIPFAYSVHLDTKRYTRGLQDFARKLGVAQMSGSINAISTYSVTNRDMINNQHIRSITFDADKKLDADLFIDCTVSGQLIHQTLHKNYIDYSHLLPCDKSIQFATEPEENPQAVTQVKAHENGFWLRFPLQDRTVCEYHYNSSTITKEQAIASLTLSENAQQCLIHQTHKAQRTETFWSGNCVAMGDAAGSLGRNAISNFHLVQSAVLRLVDLLPDMTLNERVECASRDEYNHLCEEEYARLLDYQCAYFALIANHKTVVNSPFWQQYQNVNLPESLMHKMTLFKHTGRLPFYERETFAEKTWLSLFMGLGLWPEQYDRLLDVQQRAIQDSLKACEQLAVSFEHICAQMPSHYEYLQRHCGAK